MLFLDVNVVVHSFRHEQSVEAGAVRDWLEPRLVGEVPIGVSEQVLFSMVRITTRPTVFDRPSTPEEALRFAEALLGAPAVQVVRPGARHWSIFRRLVADQRFRGNDVADAYLASIAMERGATLVSRDRGFHRFEGLRVVDPLA